jgi:hypothetical protein
MNSYESFVQREFCPKREKNESFVQRGKNESFVQREKNESFVQRA